MSGFGGAIQSVTETESGVERGDGRGTAGCV